MLKTLFDIAAPVPAALQDSWYFLWIAIVVVASIVLGIVVSKSNDKTFRIILLVLWIIIVAFEIFKQIFYTFIVGGGVYDTDIIPYQFCSLALYAYPFIIFGKDSKFRDGMILFAASYVFFAGLIVYGIHPFISQLNKPSLVMSIQTSLHHAIQMVVGILLVIHEFKKFTFKNFLLGSLYFLVGLAVAVIANETLYPLMPTAAAKNNFNLFYVSSHNATYIPIIDSLQFTCYPLFLLLYAIGFGVAALLMYLALKYVHVLVDRIKK